MCVALLLCFLLTWLCVFLDCETRCLRGEFNSGARTRVLWQKVIAKYLVTTSVGCVCVSVVHTFIGVKIGCFRSRKGAAAQSSDYDLTSKPLTLQHKRCI